MTNITEIDKLAKGLGSKGIDFKICRLFDGLQILCDGWDAICHCGSYGHEEGLLEIAGTIVQNKYDDVEGWLTAEDILKRLE